MTAVLVRPGFMISVLAQVVAIAGLLVGAISPPVALAVVVVQFVAGLVVAAVEDRVRGKRSVGVAS